MPKERVLGPKDHLIARNWREFFRSLPDDTKDVEFSVRNPQDLMNLRVTASQLKGERKYKLAVNFVKSTIRVTVINEQDGNS